MAESVCHCSAEAHPVLVASVFLEENEQDQDNKPGDRGGENGDSYDVSPIRDQPHTSAINHRTEQDDSKDSLPWLYIEDNGQ